MSNRYEEVIRLVLDVETDKLEKKTVDAQERVNRRARQSAEPAGPEVGRGYGGRSARSTASPPGQPGARPSAGGVAELYRALGHTAGSLMRGQMPAVGHVTQLLRRFSGGGGGGGGASNVLRNLMPSAGRATAAATTPSHAAAIRAGNAGTLGSGRPAGMPPTPPAPPRRTPPPIPPGAPPLLPGAGGGGGFINRGVGLFNKGMGAIGGGGAAGAAGIAGLVLISLKHLASGIGKYTNAIGLWGKAFVTGDASKALKGAVSYAQGVAHMFGPIMGALMSKIIGVYGGFIDALDGLVEALGKYNPMVAAHQRVYEVQQKMFRIRMAAVFEPLMSAWLELKSAVLDLMSSLAPLFQGLVNIFASIVRMGTWFVTTIRSLLPQIVATFQWLQLRLMGIWQGTFDQLLANAQKSMNGESLGQAAGKFTKSILGAANSLDKWQKNQSTRREKPLWQRATSGDGSVIPRPGAFSPLGSRRYSVKDTLLQEYLKGKMSDEEYKKLGGDLEAAKKAKAEQARRRANIAGLAPVWRGGRSGDKLPDDPLRYVPASPKRPTSMKEPGDSLPSAAKPKDDPDTPAKLPLTPQVSFNQKIENKFQMSIANDAAVRESVSQVRDKLLACMNTAADEASLTGALVGGHVSSALRGT